MIITVFMNKQYLQRLKTKRQLAGFPRLRTRACGQGGSLICGKSCAPLQTDVELIHFRNWNHLLFIGSMMFRLSKVRYYSTDIVLFCFSLERGGKLFFFFEVNF